MIRLLIGALALALVLGGRRRYHDEDQDERAVRRLAKTRWQQPDLGQLMARLKEGPLTGRAEPREATADDYRRAEARTPDEKSVVRYALSRGWPGEDLGDVLLEVRTGRRG